MRFKVGDSVVIKCIDPKWIGHEEYEEYEKLIGRCAKIVEVRPDGVYRLDWDKHMLWDDMELESAKHIIVSNILNDL